MKFVVIVKDANSVLIIFRKHFKLGLVKGALSELRSVGGALT